MEEAVSLALADLNLSQDEVDISNRRTFQRFLWDRI